MCYTNTSETTQNSHPSRWLFCFSRKVDMQTEKPAYYAVLEAEVRYDKNISSTAKLIYAEVTALTQKEGYAWATNKYFADNFNISPSQVSRIMSDLQEAGYIAIEIKDKFVRKITLRKNVKPLRKNAVPPTQKAQTPPTQKAQYNNTRENNILNRDFNKNVEDNRGNNSEAKERLRAMLKEKGIINNCA